MKKQIKYIIENVVNFNPADYGDDEKDIISDKDVDNVTQYKHFPKTKKELKDLIEERFLENPEEPYLSDISTYFITDMSELFNMTDFFTFSITRLSSLKTIKKLDLSAWDVSNVKSMEKMFAWNNDLVEINMSGWDTSNVTNMSGMFYICKSLTDLDITHFNTSNVTNMYAMF